jgi:hypothetical protein
MTVPAIKSETTTDIPNSVATTTEMPTSATTSKSFPQFSLGEGPRDFCWQRYPEVSPIQIYAPGMPSANYTKVQALDKCFILCEQADQFEFSGAGYRCSLVFFWYDTTVQSYFCSV